MHLQKPKRLIIWDGGSIIIIRAKTAIAGVVFLVAPLIRCFFFCRYVDLLLGEFKHYKTRLDHGGISKEVSVRINR